MELGRLEFSQGNIDLARDYFQDLIKTSNCTYAIICLINLFIKQNEYMNALKYIIYLEDSKIPLELKKQVKMLELYMMKELNIFFDKETKIGMNYNNYQAVDYDEFVAIEHIIDGHKEEFSTGIDVYRLFNDIRGKLTDEYKFINLSVNDIYYMPYENIGDDCHILCVVTLPNSKNILTMYPLTKANCSLDDDSLINNTGMVLQRKK